MKLTHFFLSCFATLTFASSLPYSLPFHTGPGPNIFSSNGKKVQLVGTNWPGQQEAMIPEGLQYSSIKNIVSKIRSLKLNIVRLTFAIEMVDDILDNRGDVTLEQTLVNALGAANGTIILHKILRNNPQFSPKSTRLQVFDAVAKELAAQGIYLHLDNHMSKATWCCGTGDGNAWFGDTDFDVAKWIRGWRYISAHVRFKMASFQFQSCN
jgi:endoglucanase